ncbi:hypothetical protein [Ralstonia pickettii]|uniref:hypothetical protein n=1 Tax=Cupriavidus sp. DF5525 TaxID=3160989 RepID=UPI0003B03C44|nr:hypothetical protein N234_18805 [Ralstonia pickettii DTP0602]AGW92883.1 hypothetical protein N234_22930 [Ralstonia pickettii DTP0602]AGW95568.1 hypothetical protein N234_36510 [Ralstonia pickettii DTP0602]
MAQTTAQRQAAYRARRVTTGNDGNGERRLSMWVTTEADFALARLARRYSVTKREMLERLIVRADDAIVRRLDPDSPDWDTYFFARRAPSHVTG